MNQGRHPARQRRGTTSVEVAVILPAFLTFILGIIEFGHIQMVSNVLQTATRVAARQGATEGVSTAEVTQRVRDLIATVVDPNQVDILVKDASVLDTTGALPATSADYQNLPNINLDEAETRQLFLVRVTVPFSAFGLLGNVDFLPGDSLSAITLRNQSIMRHE